MNYEQKYKGALEKAREVYNRGYYVMGDLETIFPELKESEDERIRKHLISLVKNWDKDGIVSKYTSNPNDIKKILAWLEKQGEPVDKGEISDGFHTFNELYYYRMLYNAAFFNMLPKSRVHKSKKHNDGEECFGGGWFIVMANLPTGQISNHYELKDWDLFQIPEKERADKWDGHTPQEAAERLHNFLLEEKDKQKSGWSEEDERIRKTSIAFLQEFAAKGYENAVECMDWLKNLKGVWTEPDRTILDGIIDEIEVNKNEAPSYDLPTYDKYLNWLKSLKNKIKND